MSRPPVLAACLPSYGEEATIQLVAERVADGLDRLRPRLRPVVVHVDCGSPDDTVERFRALRLPVPALQRTADAGKGNALRTFFNVCRELDARYALTFDTDLTTLTPEWVAAFAEPLLSGTAGAVLPDYPRGAYEASTTYHLAVPVVYACSGRLVPQPIGGEFGFDLDAVDPERVDWSGATLRYGVDIALTFAALRDAGAVSLVDPGLKLHRPSFFHLPEVFREVAETALRTAGSARFPDGAAAVPERAGPRLWERGGNHQAQSRALFAWARAALMADGGGGVLPALDGAPDWDDPALPDWTAAVWTRTLADAVRTAGPAAPDPAAVARALTPLFVVRATGFWLRADRDGLSAAEQSLMDQARRVRALACPAPRDS